MAKIMLCDDSKTIIMLLEKKLSDAGHKIIGKAYDGNEGVKVFSETSPELCLLDITMPNKDGRDCLREILKLNPAAKAIMVSALKDDAVEKECLKSGAKAFISKSKIHSVEDFKEILKVIDTVLKAA